MKNKESWVWDSKPCPSEIIDACLPGDLVIILFVLYDIKIYHILVNHVNFSSEHINVGDVT